MPNIYKSPLKYTFSTPQEVYTSHFSYPPKSQETEVKGGA